MRQTDSGVFAFFPSTSLISFNVIDQALIATGIGVNTVRTAGNTILNIPALQTVQELNQSWTLYSASIQGYLALAENPSAGDFAEWSGKFGQIIGGIILDEYTTLQPPGGINGLGPSGNGGFGTLQPLPKDKTLVGPMWDPAIHSMPPVFQYNGTPSGVAPSISQYLPIDVTIQPPNPLQILPTYSMGVGIWMFPSLYTVVTTVGGPQNTQLLLVNSSYSVTYDDGR